MQSFGEVRGVLPADRVAAVAADRQALAGDGEVAGLGAQWPLGHHLVVHVQPGGAVGLVALPEPLLGELDPRTRLPGWSPRSAMSCCSGGMPMKLQTYQRGCGP